MFYLNCDAAATRPSLTCDGLVCIPVPGSINVLNPSTGELLRFPSGPNPVKTDRYDGLFFDESWWDIFPGYWAMGFGRDGVNGRYKVVRMFFDTKQSEILDINIGEWRLLPRPPPYYVEANRKSTCVNGSIYWLQYIHSHFKILALDLHRLTIAITNLVPKHWKLDIWTMDAQEETWSKTYTICLFSEPLYPRNGSWRLWCRPLAVSKRGIIFHDSENRLFKYYPRSDLVQCISDDIRVISPFTENLSPLRHVDSTPGLRTFGFQHLMPHSWISNLMPHSWISKTFRQIELQIPDFELHITDILYNATLVLVIFLGTRS